MISRSQQSQPLFIYLSVVFLLTFILSGCNPDDGAASNPNPVPTNSQQPIANITGLDFYTAGQTVTLDGSDSSDPDGATLSYQWAQTDGPDITLSNTTSQTLTFVAPAVAEGRQFTFQLTVHDGELSNSASMSVLIAPNIDTTAPSIVSRSPQPNQSGVSTTAEIRVGFDEALLESRVDNQSLLISLNGTPVAGVVSYDSVNHTITNKPTSALFAGATYTVTLDNTLADLSGNVFAGDSWNFSTGNTDPTPEPTPDPNADIDRPLPKHWHESGGFGTNTQGGLGGEVYKVTNLNNSGAGSFRDAVSSGNRLVVFEVGGVIDLEENDINISSSNITIAGQTAPYPGISLLRGNLSANGKDIVVSHISIQLGTVSGENDTSNIRGDNVVFDHVAAYWARDENLSIHGVSNVTLYKSIIAEGLQYSGHEDVEHSKGSLINNGVKKLSLIGNLYAHNALRNPRVDGGEIFIANDVVYNWAPGWDHQGPHADPNNPVITDDWFNVVMSARLGCNVTMVGSVGLQGPESVGEYLLAGHYGRSNSANGYVDDNIIKDQQGNDLTVVDKSTIKVLASPAIWPEGMVPLPADEALYEVLRTVGPRPGERNFHNQRLVRTVADGNGAVIDSQEEVGGYPLEAGIQQSIEVPAGLQARQDWLDALEDEIAVDREIDLSRLYSMVGSEASDRLNNSIGNNTGNRPPVAKIRSVTEKMPGQIVTLDGIGSSDADGDALTFQWTQIRGENITLSNTSNQTLNFIAPTVTQPTQYTFKLTVNDGKSEDQASVTVLISPVTSAGLCDTGEEGKSLMLSCPSGQVITEVSFASYGTPGGSCGMFTTGSCSASNSVAVVTDACKGKNSCTLYAGNDSFGDPCGGTVKKLAAEVVCGMTTDTSPDSTPTPNPDTDLSKLRVIASTDIGGSDSDDEQSMVHFLVYADHWDVEGLIASPWEDGRKEDILRIIDEYEQDYPNLVTHGDYPTADYLRSVTKQGAIDKAPAAGFGAPTEGSEWIAEVAMRDDPRPLWITVWGCIDDVAQALHDHPEIAPRLRVYWIAGPNRKHSPDSSSYLAENHKDLWIIEADETYRGFFNGGDMSNGYGNSDWPQENVKGHGALGDFFMNHRSDIKMGDTPAVTYTLDNAMRNPDDPMQPGWGGAFIPCGGDRPNCWKDDPSQSDEGYDGAATVNIHRKAVLDDWEKMMDRTRF